MKLIISLIVLVFIFWKIFGSSNFFQSGSKGGRSKGLYHWKGRGTFKFNVVGESYYQDAIERIASKSGNGKRTVLLAHIVPENNNQYDEFAVRVELNGKKVGHLSKGDARKFRSVLTTKNLGTQVTTCNAEIRGGGIGRNDTELSYGVFLDMSPFD